MNKKYVNFWLGTAAFLFMGTASVAQQLDVEWVTPFMGTGRFTVVTESAQDPEGNLFVVGSFRDSIEVNTTGGQVKLVAGDTEDMFVSKLNPSGAVEWVKQVGGKGVLGSNASGDQFNNHYFSIVTDNQGHLYITGNYKDTADFDPGSGSVLRATPSYLGGSFPGMPPPIIWYENGFILSLNNDGEFRWVRTLFGKANSISGIALDQKSGTLTVTGYFSDTVDFNNRLGTDKLGTQPPGKNVFVARYDTTGAFKWVKRMGGGSKGTGSEGIGISINEQGDIFTTGVFSDSADFDPGAGVDILRSVVAPAQNVFVSKLDSNGNHVWAKAMGSATGSSGARGSAIVADHSGNVLTTGYFQGTGRFDPGSTATIPGTSNLSMFVSKLDSLGNFVWAKSFDRPAGTGNAGVDHGTTIAVDEQDAVYIGGYFYGAIFLDPNGSNINRDTFKSSVSQPDPMLFKLNASGDFEWGKTVNTSANSRGYHVLVARSQEVYFTGNFSKTAEFNPGGANPHQITGTAVSADGFALKYYCTDTSLAEVTLDECGDSIAYNGVLYTSSGTYTQHHFNAVGCDSTLTIHLTLNPVITPEIVVSGFRLSTMTPYKTYQWMREGQKIDGATDSVHVVTQNGKYQVAVTTDADCPDTSRIYEVTNVSVDDLAALTGTLKLFPNPVTDRLHIASSSVFDVQILSVEGKLLRTENGTNTIFVQDLTPGLYFLRISDTKGNMLQTDKFIKE